MSQEEAITLHVQSLDQLIEPGAPSPFPGRRLREDAERFILEHVGTVPRNRCPRLIVHVAGLEPVEARHVAEAVRQHFAFRRDEAEKVLRRVRRFGWRTLLIALGFLGMTMVVVQIIKRFLPPGTLASVLLYSRRYMMPPYCMQTRRLKRHLVYTTSHFETRPLVSMRLPKTPTSKNQRFLR